MIRISGEVREDEAGMDIVGDQEDSTDSKDLGLCFADSKDLDFTSTDALKGSKGYIPLGII
jgi:hypothetical protein